MEPAQRARGFVLENAKKKKTSELRFQVIQSIKSSQNWSIITRHCVKQGIKKSLILKSWSQIKICHMRHLAQSSDANIPFLFKE